jgi:hypothetical protein
MMISMKPHFTGFAVAALLVIGFTFPSFAEDAPAPAAPPAPPAVQTEAPPPSIPRPSIVPKTAEPASAPAAAEPAVRPRRTAHRHWRRYGTYRTAYWEPFPVYWPHLYRNRIHWNRIPWIFHF